MYPDEQTISIFGTEITWPGLAPVSGKFTNGDFNDPLIKPSFIPAETINLILDNLSSFIQGLGLTPNNTDPDQLLNALNNKFSPTETLLDYLFPLGSGVVQGLNDLSPLERGLPGQWEIWNSRADGYGLRADLLPNYTIYTPGNNYASGVYVLYHLLGDDSAIFQAKEAITNAPVQLDPVKWDKLPAGIIVERRHLQGWDDEDFTIGNQVNNGQYSGWYVSEIIVPGGKYPSFAGGNRPRFVLDGTAEDVSRPIEGRTPRGQASANSINVTQWDGALGSEPIDTFHVSLSGNLVRFYHTVLDISHVITTGPENSVRTFGIITWRRFA